MFHALPFVAAALLVGSARATSQPTLDHSAPFLGHTLELTVDAAPASQALVLFYSPHAATSTTPWGVLEIERASSQRIALGITDAQGHATFAIPIPADATLAENEAHFQALIDDPSAPAGKTLSHGVHVRLLGTRVYVTHSRGVDVVSAIRDEVVTRVTCDAASGGRPVFHHDLRVGAVMTRTTAGSYELVRFDPFFGAILGNTAFGESAMTLLTDLAEERVFVLETSGRITTIDLATGAVAGQLVLPNPAVDGMWCSNSLRTEAYVAEGKGPHALRRVDLVSLADVGSFSVADGDIRQRITSLAFAQDTVFVTSARPIWMVLPPPPYYGALTRIDLSGPQPVVTVQWDALNFRPLRAVPVPALDELVVISQSVIDYGPGAPFHHLTSLSSATPFVDAGFAHTPQHAYMSGAYDVEVHGSSVWSVGDGPAGESWEVMYRLDLETLSWTHVHTWDGIAPHDIESAHDAYTPEALYAGVEHHDWVPSLVPHILVIEAARERQIVLEHDPRAIRVVTVP